MDSVFIFLFALISTVSSLSKGDNCVTGAFNGVCKLSKDCASDQKRFEETGIKSTLCDPEDKELICCPFNPGELARKKCEEYNKYAYLNNTSTGNQRATVCPSVSPSISGGTEAVRKEFPHMAAIGYSTPEGIKYFCGGSLISEEYILTAAHCLNHPEYGMPTEVKLGAVKLDSDTDIARNYKVIEQIAYSDFRYTFYDDIALLRLNQTVEFSAFIRPACLYTESEFPVQKALASGWGQEEHSGPMNNVLMKVVLDLLDPKNCSTAFQGEVARSFSKLKRGIMPEKQFCTGSSDGKDTCKGDSGGPLQIFHDNDSEDECMHDIIGVVAFGRPCAFNKTRGGYTRVSYYIDWIEFNVWPVVSNKVIETTLNSNLGNKTSDDTESGSGLSDILIIVIVIKVTLLGFCLVRYIYLKRRNESGLVYLIF